MYKSETESCFSSLAKITAIMLHLNLKTISILWEYIQTNI